MMVWVVRHCILPAQNLIPMSKSKVIVVKQTPVSIIEFRNQDYISLTDMAKPFGDEIIIHNWLRNRNTIQFLGIWEHIYNPGFNPLEFEGVKKQAGLNSFTMSPKKWSEATSAIGIVSKAGRYGGGTYAHRDIAFEFGSWLSPEFKLYLIIEFQRLKEEENRRLSLAWNLNRTLSKLNYRIHTDAVKAHLIPAIVTPEQAAITYATEADLLNVALFGQSARRWRDANPKLEGNVRDHAGVE